MIDEVYTAQKVEQSSGALVGVTETGLPDQGRLVYGTVELQHPQSPLHLIDDIRYKYLIFFLFIFLIQYL